MEAGVQVSVWSINENTTCVGHHFTVRSDKYSY